jgi:hypothetical protein
MSESPGEEPPSTGHVDEAELEPVTRDGRFITRLILAAVAGVIFTVIVGAWLRGAAANCGSSILRPGSTVIPPR